MQLQHTDIIDAPVDQVYKLVRDKLPEIAEYLPNIRKIETIERSDDGKIVNHWYAKAELPAMVKSFVSDELLAWKDIAQWDDAKNTVDYKLESFFANDLFVARGHNTFVAKNDNQTELTLSCEVEFDASKIPGVPTFMSRKVMPSVEKILTTMLEPNLTSLGEGIRGYLEDHKDA